ncbi:hypothetical protein MMG00_01390 [Ignatzschineria rhizosphaerae]|uniref:Uncharacterized protein n=1 Tax=Ignatzschineria rhizosphaerae TaxID=2923279 RepID=A0ABY3X4D1_9GAMM|nr:hypothetical protein [Ignatzschineria rhizosphaerae]UNM96544.1 hypothetical protein MMG00_01390 [Ignatzschineria rhizosphaerae]
MNAKTGLLLLLISMLVGCKTISGAMDEEALSDAQEEAVIDEVVNEGEKKATEDRHIEEVPEVLEIIAASKETESGKVAPATVKAPAKKPEIAKASNEEVLDEVSPEEISDEVVEKPLLEDASIADICNEWKSHRGTANNKWVGQKIHFQGRMTSVSHSNQYGDSSNIVYIDANQLVSLGVMFNSIRETLRFSTGQPISLNGELSEIKRATGGRCLFIVKNADVVR